VATGVTEQLVDCSGGEEITLAAGQQRKLTALGELLNRHAVPRTIVFCNKIEACRMVENFLNRQATSQGATVLPCHAAIAPHLRQQNLRTFLAPPQPEEPFRILVCTDRCVPYLRATCLAENRIQQVQSLLITLTAMSRKRCMHGQCSS
jgi:superfamily II DNA/RNA helicase